MREQLMKKEKLNRKEFEAIFEEEAKLRIGETGK
jgi:hypothetical protein